MMQEMECLFAMEAPVNLSDQVRKLFYRNYVVPARSHGQSRVQVAVSDLNRQLKWSHRFPLICGALTAHSFHEELGVELIDATEPARAVAPWSLLR